MTTAISATVATTSPASVPGSTPQIPRSGSGTIWCGDWSVATDEVKRIAGDLPIFWGTGYPIRYPHVVARSLDAWSGAGMGYDVTRYPEGDRFMSPCEITTVRVGLPPTADQLAATPNAP